MRRRVLSLICVTVLLLSVVGCGSEESDKEKVLRQKKLRIGVTDYEPIDYLDENDEWIGFDAEMARGFASKLGVEPEFVEISWDNKQQELDEGNIDCIWNVMTLTDEVREAMDFSMPYIKNSQIVVMQKDKVGPYQQISDMKNLNFAVEVGSTGEAQAQLYDLRYTPVGNQIKALQAVVKGQFDGAIIDLLMAETMVGQGGEYKSLDYHIKLNEEEDVVGFRRGSDLVDDVNEFFKESYKDGSIYEIADKYKVRSVIMEQ